MDEEISINPYNLDWGTITPTAFSESNKEILHVFNFDISSKENIEKAIIFSTGKIIWTSKHVPTDTTQKIVFDLRGQPITLLDRARKMKKNIVEKVIESGYAKPIVIEILI